jgi:hypothetical protein
MATIIVVIAKEWRDWLVVVKHVVSTVHVDYCLVGRHGRCTSLADYLFENNGNEDDGNRGDVILPIVRCTS